MKAVCLLSGGMDSSTMTFLARQEGYEILALHTFYGQRTGKREHACARAIASAVGAIEFLDVPIDYLTRIGGSSLTDTSLEIPDFTSEEGIPNTYVPFRNGNLLSIATSVAEARGAEAIFIGVQSSDYSGYPDCRPEFIEAFGRVVELGTATEQKIAIRAPFIHMNKREILKIGMRLGVPYEHTWSCYRSDEPACGRCSSCHFRLQAFRQLGVSDPIRYER
jgi:7-cyano-7-deazaguanine synthase